MDYNYTLKYREFDGLLADVKNDLSSFDLEGKIDPSKLIKIAMKVTYDLGLRVQMTKERILEIEKGKARLPDDFNVMNYGLICGEHTVVTIPPQGTHTESLNPIDINNPEFEGVVPRFTAMGDPTVCGCPNNQKVCMQWNKEQPIIIQKVNTETRTYKFLHQIRFVNSKFINCDCPNLKYTCHDEAYIKDGWIYANFDCANMYINYQGTLEDDNGNLLVPDHPMINEYYEYALKERILENLTMNGDSVGQQLVLIQQKLRAARNSALSIVNTPNFSEMQKLWTANRLAQYSRYYDQFKSHAGQMSPRVNNAV